MRKKIITCRVCKKRFGSIGSSTCSEECFEKSKQGVTTWESLRRIAEAKKEKRKKKKEEEVKAKPLKALPQKQKTKLSRLLSKQAIKYNADREIIIRKLQGTYARDQLKEIRKENTQLRAKIKAIPQGKYSDFYESREWGELRYQVIKKYGRTCMCCGATAGVMHVDHIKPRSKHPELELIFENMQVLCRLCNMGKSNKDETDWRPK